jgi:predicted transcriptional regulator
MNWTFLSNHGHVIVQISQHPDIKLTELAAQVGITERRVREIIGDLRDAGYLEVTKSGRRNAYRVMPKKPLRHSAEATHTLAELLGVFERT